MLRGIVISALLLAITLSIAACGGSTSTPTLNPNPKPSGPIEAEWIEPQVDSDTISIPVSEVENNWNIHFELSTSAGDIAFMAYELGGKLYVRANACPPCGSIGFSLQGDILVCDTCRTTFKAKTGDGIEGACVDFPKASAPYEITDGNIVMGGDDLLAAYQNTLNPGWP